MCAILSFEVCRQSCIFQHGGNFACGTKVYKIRKLHRTIFFTFCNVLQPNFKIFTNFRMLFPAALKDFYH